MQHSNTSAWTNDTIRAAPPNDWQPIVDQKLGLLPWAARRLQDEHFVSRLKAFPGGQGQNIFLANDKLFHGKYPQTPRPLNPWRSQLKRKDNCSDWVATWWGAGSAGGRRRRSRRPWGSERPVGPRRHRGGAWSPAAGRGPVLQAVHGGRVVSALPVRSDERERRQWRWVQTETGEKRSGKEKTAVPFDMIDGRLRIITWFTLRTKEKRNKNRTIRLTQCFQYISTQNWQKTKVWNGKSHFKNTWLTDKLLVCCI